MESCSAVYNKSRFGNDILVHLMQRIPELRHTYTVQIKNDGIEISGISPATLPTEVWDRRHDRKICILDISQFFQLVRNQMSSGPTVTFDLQRDPIFTTILLSWDGQRNSISFSIFIVALPLERTFRKYLSIKLKRLHRLPILPKMVVLFPIKRPLPLQSGLLIYRHKNTSSP